VLELLATLISLFPIINLLYLSRFIQGYVMFSYILLGNIFLFEVIPKSYLKYFGNLQPLFLTIGLLVATGTGY